jgi:hypothetical protein
MKRNIDIQKEWEAIGAKFDSQIALPSFKIPDNYFDTFPETMLSLVSAPDTKAGFPVTEEAYSVPPGYFEALPLQLLQQAQAFESVTRNTSIEGLSKQNPFEAPAPQYFDQLADQLMHKIHAEVAPEEELSVSPLLASLKQSNPFSTPEISVNMEQIFSAVKPEPEVKTKKESPMFAIRRRLSFAQWSAAASIAIFFVLGALWLQTNKMNSVPAQSLASENVNVKASKLLANIPDQALAEYVEQHSEEFDEFILEANLASVPATEQTKNLEAAIGDISDEDIQAYLNTY